MNNFSYIKGRTHHYEDYSTLQSVIEKGAVKERNLGTDGCLFIWEVNRDLKTTKNVII